jgi:hypothetical protein
MATDPKLGILDAISYLERYQVEVENDFVEVFVLEIEGLL